DDIRTWAAPDLADDGVSLLAETLREVTGPDARIGLASGLESHLRMPLADYARLTGMIGARSLVPDAGIVAGLRQIKSPAEIAKIGHTCQIAGRAFARLDEIAAPGEPLSTVFRRFQMLCLQEGADWVPYLAGSAGPGGYADVISPASDAPLAEEDVLMLDTGLVWDGYFCDFDRNVAITVASAENRAAHARLIDATRAGFEAARPGARACDVFAAMRRVLPDGPKGTDAGRLGHGLGMQLTEGLSLIAADQTELRPGMVITLEPGIATPGGIMVHEEDILITANAPQYLSPPAPREIRVIG
ncbi:MAG: Xaa-Pro peptidase family protein, partial [Alphaproteobacteria bacterium]|nr:Xaa-Pro peptidase family protein [Alphaproteobacteria bacterium]